MEAETQMGCAFCVLSRYKQLRPGVLWVHCPRWAMSLFPCLIPAAISWVCNEGTVPGVVCVSSGDLISDCDPPGRCQLSRIPGRCGEQLASCSQFGGGCGLRRRDCRNPLPSGSGCHTPASLPLGREGPIGQPACSPLLFSQPFFLWVHALETFTWKVFFVLFCFFVSLVIPLFGLLSHISSLRLSSGHSSLVLTLRTEDVARTSLPNPHCLVNNTSICVTSLLAVAVMCVLCVCVCVCVFCCCCSLFPSHVALWDSKTPHRHARERISYCVFYILPYLLLKRLAFLGAHVLHQHLEVVLWKFLNIQMIFWWICEGENDLPILFLHCLGKPQPHF